MNKPIDLTAEGEARREAILASALNTAASKRRHRTAIRTGGVIAATIAVMVGLYTAMPRPAEEHRTIAVSPPSATPPQIFTATDQKTSPVVTLVASAPPQYARMIETDQNAMAERYFATPRPNSIVRIISDEQLLAELTRAGQPASLGYVGDKAILLPR